MIIPNGYEKVPYHPNKLIQNDWKRFDANGWADTLSAGFKMISSRGIEYIRPVKQKKKEMSIPDGHELVIYNPCELIKTDWQFLDCFGKWMPTSFAGESMGRVSKDTSLTYCRPIVKKTVPVFKISEKQKKALQKAGCLFLVEICKILEAGE